MSNISKNCLRILYADFSALAIADIIVRCQRFIAESVRMPTNLIHVRNACQKFVKKNRVLKRSWKATWRNWRERRGACTHCGQLNEYPTLPTPLLPTPLSPIISFYISRWYQFIFVYVSFKNLILHVFSHNYDNYLMFWDVLGCSGMFRDVLECSMFRILSTVTKTTQRKCLK